MQEAQCEAARAIQVCCCCFKDRNWAKVTGWEERLKAGLAECSADSEETGSVQKGLKPARWVASIHQD